MSETHLTPQVAVVSLIGCYKVNWKIKSASDYDVLQNYKTPPETRDCADMRCVDVVHSNRL